MRSPLTPPIEFYARGPERVENSLNGCECAAGRDGQSQKGQGVKGMRGRHAKRYLILAREPDARAIGPLALGCNLGRYSRCVPSGKRRSVQPEIRVGRDKIEIPRDAGHA